MSERLAIYAEGQFETLNGKTGHGVIRYAPREIVAVIDSGNAGRRADEVVPYCARPVPIVATVAEAAELGADRLLIGVAPDGGRLSQEWRIALGEAMALGMDVEAGLHSVLADDPDLVALATQHGRRLIDLRVGPADLDTPDGPYKRDPSLRVIQSVGSDCAIGKMTVTLELDKAARERGERSVFVATGQTGIAISGWGIAVDHVISDYIAGAAERLVYQGAEHGDLLFVEGQGSLYHPGYSGVTLGLLHGAAPDVLLLCHLAGQTAIHSYETVEIPPLSKVVAHYEAACEPVRPARVAAIALNTKEIADEAEARAAIAAAAEETGLVVDDPVRFGSDRLLDAVLAAFAPVNDPRPQRLARLLGGRMLGLSAGHSVVIESPPVGAPLVEALAAYAGRVGAHIAWLAIGGGYERAVLGSTAEDDLAREHRLHSALMRTADAMVGVDAAQDSTGLAGIPAERYAAWARGRKPGGEIRHRRHLEGSMQWAVVGFPCEVHAADAGMDYDAYADLVYGAAFCDRDGAEERWDRQGAAQARLVEHLAQGRELRIVAPGTDLTLRVDGRTWGSSAAVTNIPDGEVFTGPHEDSAEGVVTFPFPAHHAGRRIDGVRLVFERGVVVEAHADDGQDVLDAALAIDAGARRLGEVGIGTNYALPRFTGRALLDEKIGGTVHFALGSSYPETGGSNVSALHWDLVCDLRGGGELLLDGRAIQRDGVFVPELGLDL